VGYQTNMPKRWEREEGTIEHPYSALNLRLILASFGLVCFAALTGLLAWFGPWGFAVVTGVITVLAAVNVVVVLRRRQFRKRRERRQGKDVDHSIFE
jgi:membrane protein implicated in regulation of membrane protease activity